MLRNVAVQDVALLVFHAFMLLRVSVAPESGDQDIAQAWAATLFVTTAAVVALVRGEIIPAGGFRAIFYRVALFVPTLCSYFELRWLLPALRPDVVDDALLAIDLALFGATPAAWVESFWTPGLTELFAFFYYSYFFILGLNLLPMLFFGRGDMVREMMFGALVVCALGHVIYTLVPAYGPHHHMTFGAPLQGGLFWGLVRSTVASAGAQIDVFPSLHTAYPTFFALFAVRHRKRVPIKWLWPISVVLALGIVPATMVLRWHYAIDIFAGLALASFAMWVAVRVGKREALRAEQGRQWTWERLWWPSGG